MRITDCFCKIAGLESRAQGSHLQLECLIGCHCFDIPVEKKPVEKEAFLEVKKQETSEALCLRYPDVITGTYKQSCRRVAP